MKKTVCTFILVIAFSIITACSSSDPVQEELISYINDFLPEYYTISDEAGANYAKVQGENYKDDATMYDMVSTNVVPQYEKLIEITNSYEPETPEIKELHAILEEGVTIQNNAYLTLLEGLEQQDASLIDEANKLFSEAIDKFKQFDTRGLELANEHGVDMN